MNPAEQLAALFGTVFTEQRQGIEALREFHHPNAYCANAQGEITAICATELGEKKRLVLPHFPALRYLNLSGNTALEVCIFEAALPALEHLDLSGCGLRGELSLPAGFDQLRYLDLSRNQLTALKPLGRCPLLFYLDLSRNALREFSAHWLDERFPGLQYLYLSGNPLPSAKLAASEDRGSCLDFMQRFLHELKKGQTENKEFKVLLTGNGSVGKSCFAERLVYGTFAERHISTEGIVLEQFSREPNEGEHYRFLLNLWDFGGQDIYHATHRVFMQANALYLTFWDEKTRSEPFSELIEKGEKRRYENFPLDYWLHYISRQSQNSPVIVVKTKRDQDPAPHPEQYSLQQRYPQIVQCLAIESGERDFDVNGYRTLLAAISAAIVARIGVEKELPQSWADLRQHLRELLRRGDKLLPLAAYHSLADDYKIKDIKDQQEVLDWLTHTGVVFYRKDYFGNALMLDQSWAIEAVYALLRRDNEQIYRLRDAQKGRFSGADLQTIWRTKKYSPAEQELLASFMLGCEICFESEPDQQRPFAERQFTAPGLLPETEPSAARKMRKRSEVLHVQYRHNFLHQGVIQQFIVRAQTLTEDPDDIWRHGIVLSWEGQDAMVWSAPDEQRGKYARTLNVRCEPKALPLLDKVRNTLQELQGEDVQEWVSLDGLAFVDMGKLQRWPYLQIEAENGDMIDTESLKVFTERREQGRFELPKAQEEAAERAVQRLEKESLMRRFETEEAPTLIFVPDEVKVLFLQANPTDVAISWRDERDAIEESLNGAPQVVVCEQTRLDDMLDMLEDESPSILHFCGHGEREQVDREGRPQGGIVFHNDERNGPRELSAKELEALFQRIKQDQPQLKLVFLNACHSQEQAEAISRAGLFAIGTTDAVNSLMARKFAAGVYRSLAKKFDLYTAVDRGITRAQSVRLDAGKYIEAYYNGIRIYPKS